MLLEQRWHLKGLSPECTAKNVKLKMTILSSKIWTISTVVYFQHLLQIHFIRNLRIWWYTHNFNVSCNKRINIFYNKNKRKYKIINHYAFKKKVNKNVKFQINCTFLTEKWNKKGITKLVP